MNITYDQKVDALYIKFSDSTVTTKELSDGIAADYDNNGKLSGIEILDAVKRFGSKKTFEKITVENIGIAA